MNTKQKLFKQRAQRVRRKIADSRFKHQRLRLSVFKSNSHIYTQIIDDNKGTTLVAASTLSPEFKAWKENAADKSSNSSIKAAEAIGKIIAEKAVAQGITEVVFDRGGYIYHGKIQSLADAARQSGLVF